RSPSGALRTRPRSDLQPRVLHVGGAAGRRPGGLRTPAVAVLLARSAGSDSGVGRHDRGVQRAHGHVHPPLTVVRMLLIKGGTLVDEAGIRAGDVLIEGERIAAVGPEIRASGAG